MLAAIKTAALVEFNAPDYVTYLNRVFTDEPTRAAIEQWGAEETQHGRALGRWAEMADPAFKMDEAFTRFRAGYRPAHFSGEDEHSVARQPARRDDRALRGGERHLVLLLGDPRCHRGAGAEGDRGPHRRRRVPATTSSSTRS